MADAGLPGIELLLNVVLLDRSGSIFHSQAPGGAHGLTAESVGLVITRAAAEEQKQKGKTHG